MISLLNELNSTQILILSGLLGLVVGSFLSMLTYRLPRLMLNAEEQVFKKISMGGSKCPQCDASIPWYKLIPLFSWLASRGKCHNCDNKISIRYPLIEVFTASVTMICVWHFGFNIDGVAAILFSWILVAIFVIDWEHQLILDNLSLPLLWLGLLFNTQHLFASPSEAIIGAAAGYLILWSVFHIFKLITGKEGMGYGDFKLLAAFGAWFGFIALPQIILIAALSSIIITVIGILLKQRDKNTHLAFGPFLAIGGWSTLLLGSSIF